MLPGTTGLYHQFQNEMDLKPDLSSSLIPLPPHLPTPSEVSRFLFLTAASFSRPSHGGMNGLASNSGASW